MKHRLLIVNHDEKNEVHAVIYSDNPPVVELLPLSLDEWLLLNQLWRRAEEQAAANEKKKKEPTP